MQLLTAELRAQLPAIYAQTDNPDPLVRLLCSREHKAYYAALSVM
jgi:hypothetical protein